MRKSTLILTAIITFGVGTLLAVPAARDGDKAKIEQLIRQLGSNNFRQRESATRELDALGSVALAELKKASQSNDMEVATRAKALCEKIEARELNAKLIAPTYVELKFDQTPVEEAIAELSKKSGISIVIGGDKSRIAGRKITLDTGRVAFWSALTQLCEKADLTDTDHTLSSVQGISVQPRPLPPIRNPAIPIQIQPIQIQPAVPVIPIQIQPAVPIQPIQIQPKPIQPAKPIEKAPAPIKEQAPKAQPAQAVPAQPAIPAPVPARMNAIRRPIGGVVQNTTTIVLFDGKAKYPSYGENAIRVCATPTSAVQSMQFPQPGSDEIGLVINLTAEPRIQLQQFLGVKIEKCLDDCKQDLSMCMTGVDPQPVGGGNIQVIKQIQANGAVIITSTSRVGGLNYGPSFFPIKLKKGEKETTIIKELIGVASVKIRTPEEELAAIRNILKAKGESTRGKGDCELKVANITKGENGDITAELDLTFSTEIQPSMNRHSVTNPTQPLPPAPGAGIKIQIRPAIAPVPPNGVPAAQPVQVVFNNTGIELQDEKGNPYLVTRVQYTRNMWQQTTRTMSVTMTFKPAHKDQGEAVKLIFKGTRLAAVDVPFVLKNVPIK